MWSNRSERDQGIKLRRRMVIKTDEKKQHSIRRSQIATTTMKHERIVCSWNHIDIYMPNFIAVHMTASHRVVSFSCRIHDNSMQSFAHDNCAFLLGRNEFAVICCRVLANFLLLLSLEITSAHLQRHQKYIKKTWKILWDYLCTLHPSHVSVPTLSSVPKVVCSRECSQVPHAHIIV